MKTDRWQVKRRIEMDYSREIRRLLKGFVIRETVTDPFFIARDILIQE